MKDWTIEPDCQSGAASRLDEEILIPMNLPAPKVVDPPHLDKDIFMRSVIRELAGVLEQTVGEQEAEAYVNYVGLVLGRSINKIYRQTFASQQLDLGQVAAALVDLKSRIDGGFAIESQDTTSIVLVNSRCPFGEKVVGRPSLCRMTANVFGCITAENLGYARVRIDEAIARGDARCRVVVELQQPDGAKQDLETEFFGPTM